MNSYLIVSGDFVKTGGMDRANYALASYLAESGINIHLVAHEVDAALQEHLNVIVHRVPKLLNSYMASEPLLNRAGRQYAAKIRAQGGRVIVNGGNCNWNDANWVHYVHAAYSPREPPRTLRHLKNRLQKRLALWQEAKVIRSARLVIANSMRTKMDLMDRLAIPESSIKPVYYGIDKSRFRPATARQKAKARADLNWASDKPVIVFIGALGDRRKGFDTVFKAWCILCASSVWDANLVAVGSGAELPAWMKRAESAGMSSRIQFLGRRNDVPRVLAASDALVAPTRYEAYGLAVHEALCCGLPAVVTRSAGVAEQYPAALEQLLIPDPENAADLAERLRLWSADRKFYETETALLAERLRQRTWDDMAAEIVGFIESRQ